MFDPKETAARRSAAREIAPVAIVVLVAVIAIVALTLRFSGHSASDALGVAGGRSDGAPTGAITPAPTSRAVAGAPAAIGTASADEGVPLAGGADTTSGGGAAAGGTSAPDIAGPTAPAGAEQLFSCDGITGSGCVTPPAPTAATGALVTPSPIATSAEQPAPPTAVARVATSSPVAAPPPGEAPQAPPTAAPSPPASAQSGGGDIAPVATQTPGTVERAVDAVTGLLGLGH
jgi:hypothetical protein